MLSAKPKAKVDKTYTSQLDLDYSGYHENRI